MIDFGKHNNISDEMLAAYIDGQTSLEENALIEDAVMNDDLLSESLEIAHDSISFGRNFDWELHKGDYGFWELGIPPIIDESDNYIETAGDQELQTGDSLGELNWGHTDEFLQGEELDIGTENPDLGNFEGADEIDS